MIDKKYLEIKKEGFVTWVYLNRLDAMNALSIDVLKEITAFNNDLKRDLETRVVIYTGKGLSLIHISEPTRRS